MQSFARAPACATTTLTQLLNTQELLSRLLKLQLVSWGHNIAFVLEQLPLFMVTLAVRGLRRWVQVVVCGLGEEQNSETVPLRMHLSGQKSVCSGTRQLTSSRRTNRQSAAAQL